MFDKSAVFFVLDAIKIISFMGFLDGDWVNEPISGGDFDFFGKL